MGVDHGRSSAYPRPDGPRCWPPNSLRADGGPRRLLPRDLRPRPRRRDAGDPGRGRRAGARRRREAMEPSAPPTTSAPGPAARTRSTPTPRPSAAAGSCRGCCATSPSATSRPRVLGTAMPAPLLLAPIGVQKVVHDEGELATARAAAAVGVPMIASTASHFTPRGDRRGRRRGARAGSSSTGPTTASWSRASSAAPRRPATARSSSPSTPSSPAGSRATCSRPGCPSSTAWASPTTSRTRSSAPALEKTAGGGRRRRHRPLPRRPGQPGAELGRPRLAARADLAADPDQGDPARRRRPRGGARAASTASSSPTTAAARSTARSPRSTPCRRSPRRSATTSRSSSTAASAAAPTCSRRSPSAPTPSASAAPTSGAWRWTARPGVEAVLKMVLAELDLTMALCGLTRPDQLGPDCLASVASSPWCGRYPRVHPRNARLTAPQRSRREKTKAASARTPSR